MRHQLQSCYTFHICKKSAIKEIELGPTDIEITNSFSLVKRIPSISDKTVVTTLKYVQILGKMLCPGDVFVIRFSEDGPHFGELKNIFYCSCIYFEVQEFETIYFNKYYHAYSVRCTNNGTKIINIDEVPRTSPCLLVKLKSEQFV